MKQDERWEQVAAYCESEMSEEERIAFDRRITECDELRQMMQSWRETMEEVREWHNATAPSEERVDSLPIPSFVRKQYRPIWRRLAAAALFIAGFGLGLLAQREMNVLDEISKKAIVRPETTEKAAVVDSEPTRTPPESFPQNCENEQTKINSPLVTQANKPIVTQQDDGRLVIETTSNQSGVRMVWIVDSGFQLSHTNTNSQGE